jgi:hypothetical protein
MKQNFPTENQIVNFFKEKYQSDNYDCSSSAEECIQHFSLEPIIDLDQFKDTFLRLRMQDHFTPEISLEERIVQFTELNKFILNVKIMLGYKLKEYIKPGEAILKKIIDPPSSAFEYIGHNKMDIEDSRNTQALLY